MALLSFTGFLLGFERVVRFFFCLFLGPRREGLPEGERRRWHRLLLRQRRRLAERNGAQFYEVPRTDQIPIIILSVDRNISLSHRSLLGRKSLVHFGAVAK